jgi:hypothetical protein
LEVIIGIKTNLATTNPILRKWVQSRVGLIFLEPSKGPFNLIFCFIIILSVTSYLVYRELNMKLYKFDELESLMSGLRFIAENNPEEIYYWQDPLSDEKVFTLINFSIII